MDFPLRIIQLLGFTPMVGNLYIRRMEFIFLSQARPHSDTTTIATSGYPKLYALLEKSSGKFEDVPAVELISR